MAFEKRLASVFVTASIVACVPDFQDDRARVSDVRIVAVQSVPAEAKPGARVTLSALVVSPSGEVSTDLAWSLCVLRKPLTELGPVSDACVEEFGRGGEGFVRLAHGPATQATLPEDACRLFGPLVPPAPKGGIAGMPVDADPSGGFYQPVVVGSSSGTALGSVRLSCGVAGVPNAEAVRYSRGYRPNDNPKIEPVVLPTQVRLGERVPVRVAWATCPSAPVCGDGLCTAGEDATSCAADCRNDPQGCSGAEVYLAADEQTRTIRERRERLTVSYYATGGHFDVAQSEGETDVTFVDNVWSVPSSPGRVHLWFVLRDDRGGVGWREAVVDVVP